MNIQEVIEKMKSGDVPVFELGGAGITILPLALKWAKGLFRIILVLAALGLMGAAGWWYYHHR
jgi:hypothetical protein